ncbi:amidohydrolase [Acinetobacter sp. WCHAc060025]|uniref:amidohydrolase n=1 Tax=Acinetobacter sp. WCHAc060025 TaxID=2518625 RepID=UPI001023EECD|nr:amidohydrolase [Acinetobacter sp. WCHAc060025]RZG78090.1 amidohydrolase [Acinetobacter sp. WCHAc060025]
MKRIQAALLATPLLILSQISSADWVKDAVIKTEPQTIQLRHQIHQHPELGNMEFNTSKLVQKELKSYGIEVKTGYAKTGVVGVLKGALPGPVMALRADMDALPVEEKTGLSFASKVKALYQGKQESVMHACGHDTHTAMLLSAAKVLAENKDKLAGTVVFVFQPAEEGAADIDNFTQGDQIGSRKMIADGAFKQNKPEVIFGIHVISGMPTGNLFYKSGAILNSADEFRIKLTGQQVHASMPWAGTDPIVTSAQVITNLQTLISRQSNLTKGMGVVSVGQISGGTVSNVIPEEVSMAGTIRTNNEAIRQNILKKLPEMVKFTALANNVKANVDISSYAPVTTNDKTLTELTAPALETAVGKSQLHLLDNNASPSEDFAYYGKLMPSLFVFLGATPADQDMAKAAPNHSSEFVVDDATLKTGVETHVRFILNYPSIAKQVQASWKAQ